MVNREAENRLADRSGNDDVRPTRQEIFGVPVDCVSLKQAIQIIDGMVTSGTTSTVVAVNPEKVMAARRNPELARFLDGSGLLIPDGIGVVLAARLLGLARLERVAGADLMPEICSLAARRGYRVFLYGGRPDVNQAAGDALRRSFPGINIVGQQHGYLAEEELGDVVDAIRESRAQILFIALGSPKQEEWMQRHLEGTGVAVCQGVGGTFDVLAGTVRRAPKAFRKIHLEWLYRLLSDPRRISRHRSLVIFGARVLQQSIKRLL